MSTEKKMTGYPSIDKPWLKNYPSILFKNRMHYERIIDNLRAVWSDDNEAIINYYDTQITTKDFFTHVETIAKSLCAIGVQEGQSIAVSLESVPEFLEILLACELIGCSVKNLLKPSNEAIELIQSCTADIYITHDYITHEDAEIIYSNTRISHILTIDPLNSAINQAGIRYNIRESILERYINGKSNHVQNVLWSDFLKMSQNIANLPAVEKGHILFSAFTSGTTGRQKEVLHTSESMLGVIRQIALLPAHEKPRPTWLLTILPPSLVAVVVAMMLYPLAAGKQLILDPFCKMEDIDLEMMHFKPNAWGIVPSMFDTLLDSKRIPDDYDMSHWVQFGAGAETLTTKLALRLQDFFDKHNCKAPLCTGYGQSEGGSDFTISVGNEMVLNGCAGMPLIDTVISVFEPGTTTELKYNQIGEVCKAGPGLMVGYADLEMTKETLKMHPDGNIWLHTGDYGFMTEDGLLFVLGRNGINVYPDKVVYPLPVENKILALQGLKDAIIVTGNDADHDGFEKLYLFVVLEEDCAEATVIPELEKHIKNALLPEERPARIFVIDKKPIRGFKTDRKYLKERYSL